MRPILVKIADVGMLDECSYFLEKWAFHAANMAEEIHFLVDRQCFKCDRRRDRVACIGVPVREMTNLIRCRHHSLEHALVDHQGRDRLQSRRQCLRTRDHVGLQLQGLRAPHLARATEAADHFVRNEENVVLPQDSLDLLKIAPWG